MKRPPPASNRSSRSSLRPRCECPRCERLEDRSLMSVQFIIDPLQDVKPISPYIYGINQPLAGYSNYTFERLGGDLTTDWNWENGDSNAGHDYYYQNESLSYFTGGTTAPAARPSRFLKATTPKTPPPCSPFPSTAMSPPNTANDDVLSDPVTTVTGPVSATATVIPVANAAAIPSTPYYIVIDSEEMEVTSVNLTQNELTVVRGISGGTATPQANDPVYLSPDVRNSGANYLQTQFEPGAAVQARRPGLFHAQPHPRRPRLRGRVRQLGQYHVSLWPNQHDHAPSGLSWTTSRTSGTPRTPRFNRPP